IGQMRLAFCIQQNVSRFDVAMKNAVCVRVMHSARHLCHQFCRLTDRHRRAPDYFVKLAALDKSPAQVASGFPFAYLIDRYDPWMIELGGGFGFPPKAL